MTAPPLHTLGMHANHLSRATDNHRMQAILQWVGVGSVILMGLGAGAHLLKDVVHAFKDTSRAGTEPYPRQKHQHMLDELDRHYSKNEGRDRSR